MVRVKKKRLLIYFTGVIVIVFFIVCALSSDRQTGFNTNSSYKMVYENKHFKAKSVKVILKWTSMFQHGTVAGDRKCLSECEAKCIVTDDKSQIENADAVEFHLSDIWTKFWRINTKSVIEFPKYRRADQVWILGNMEPPPHLWGNIRILNGLFNWTKWYRSDADILWPYGEVYRYNRTEHLEALNKYKNRNFYREKSKEVLLRISNCFDPGRRYKIVKNIEQFVKVDKYGACYHKICGDSQHPDDQSCSNLMKQYKFYLAFENDNCKDYVTEKYWMTLERDQIPIVNWKSINPSSVIPKSFINIFDFDSIEQFAEYLKQVSKNETLYNSYFEYKKIYTNRRTTCHACDTCHALHEKNRLAQVYTDIDAWVQDDFCQKVGVSDKIRTLYLLLTSNK